MSSKDKIKQFWKNARMNPGSSSKCYLDGRYFNYVLGPYEGTVQEPIHITVEENQRESSSIENVGYQVFLKFNDTSLNRTSGPVRLIKVVIEVGQEDSPDAISIHSNLVWIDMRNKIIYRFEPIDDDPYFDDINEALVNYFNVQMPEYGVELWNEHPQMLNSGTCPGRGMCSAFVLMQAMKILTGYNKSFPTNAKQAEAQILQFAFAIEQQYGKLNGKPEYEYGYKANWKKFKGGVKNAWGEYKQKLKAGKDAAKVAYKEEGRAIKDANAERKLEAAKKLAAESRSKPKRSSKNPVDVGNRLEQRLEALRQ